MTTAPRFIGMALDCLRHFLDKHDKAGGELIATFCGNKKYDTVREWYNGKSEPAIQNAVQLWTFLDVAGYDVAELARLDQPRRELALLIGFNVNGASATSIAGRLGYSGDRLHSLWRILRNSGGYSEEVGRQMGKLNARFADSVGAERAALTIKIRQLGQKKPARTTEVTQPLTAHSHSTTALAVAFGRSMDATITLATMLRDADEGSAARDATRSGQNMQELIALMQELLSQ